MVAGLWQFGRTTSEEFYFNLGICFEQPLNFRLIDSNRIVLPRDETIVATGVYYVISAGIIFWSTLV